MAIYEISMKWTIDDEFLFDVMTTMIESQAMFWAREFEVKRQPESLSVKRIDFKAEDQEGDTHRYVIHPYSLAKTIERVMRSELCADYIKQYIINAVTTGDAGEVDEEAADVLAQVHCFGQLVYG